MTPLSGLLKLPGTYGETRVCALPHEERQSLANRRRDGIVKEQITGNNWRGRRAARLAGALALLLALVPLAGGALPAYADDLEPPPPLPHYFTGTVSTLEGPVPEGTVVEAFLDGVKKDDATVDAESRYELDVPGEVGDDGKIVSFKVAGVQANQTTAWVSGELDYDFNLTIAALPNGSPFPFPFPFECFIATAAYGTPTVEQIDVLREFRDAVMLKGIVGSQFVALYYRLSPPIADFMARSDLLRTPVRELLVDPVVWIVEATGDIWRN